MTVTHVALFKFKPEASAADIQTASERILGLKDTCVHPASQKPYIISTRGGTDDNPIGMQDGLTHAFIVELPTAEDLRYFLTEDPKHLELAKFVEGVGERVVCLDFTPGVFTHKK